MVSHARQHPPRAPRAAGFIDPVGFWVGLAIIGLWLATTAGWLALPHALPLWAAPLAVLLQTHLYTGLFITAHDAMHGIAHPNPGLNRWLGRVAAFLFAFNIFDRLLPKHHLHHRHVATRQDPDYHHGSFLAWYARFVFQYVAWWQMLLMAAAFNGLKLIFPTEHVILYWMLPSILSTLQLFYFGTYLPHRGTHAPDNLHRARSQRPNHVWAFLSCYFFGYHYEHHDQPWVPWWRLWRFVGK